jgi:type VI secretion system secreted protein VgrG
MVTSTISQADRGVSVHCKLPDDDLLFQSLEGSEQLGRLYEYRIKLLAFKNDIAIADVLGKEMAVRLDVRNDGKRFIHGLVTRFSRHGSNGAFFAYEAIIRPALWLLTRSTNCRIFQEKTTLDILKEVLDGAYGGEIKFRVDLNGSYDIRPYCVQYRESDYDFISRLLEEEGIYYFFEHEENAHTMVLVDAYGSHQEAPGYEAVSFYDGGGRGTDREEITRWSPSGQIEANVFSLNDFDFEKVASSRGNGLLTKTKLPPAFDLPAYEQYDYPGRFHTTRLGDRRTRGWSESVHGQSAMFSGDASARGLVTGTLFALEDHPVGNENCQVLITAATLSILAQDYISGSGSDAALTVSCSFAAVGKEHNYRPQRIQEKPVVRGPQTAMVVGKSGEEIWTDQYGRVKVQFHWDREGKDDENSSCWVRVSQSWSGKGWGTMFIPRVGMEVVVEFLDGDPDRPLITGCVYNSDALPEHQTRSTIMSNSSKGGGGFNEIRFEDKQDKEEIFIQAERDFNRVVKNNDTLKVGFEKKDKGDQTIDIKNDQSLDIGNDQKIHIKNDQTLTIDQNQTVKIDGNQEITVGQKIVIEATTSIELKVGGSSIKIEPAKITLKSVQIDIGADAMMKIKAGGIMTVEGALVKIN